MVPNIDGTMGHKIETRKHPRHGIQCVIQYPTNRNATQSLQENAITVFGPRLYNSLIKCLRDIESVKTEKLKFELDKFIEFIPDEPKMPIMSPQQEASVSSTIYLILGLKEFTKVVECRLFMPRSRLSCLETTPSIQVSK